MGEKRQLIFDCGYRAQAKFPPLQGGDPEKRQTPGSNGWKTHILLTPAHCSHAVRLTLVAGGECLVGSVGRDFTDEEEFDPPLRRQSFVWVPRALSRPI